MLDAVEVGLGVQAAGVYEAVFGSKVTGDGLHVESSAGLQCVEGFGELADTLVDVLLADESACQFETSAENFVLQFGNGIGGIGLSCCGHKGFTFLQFGLERGKVAGCSIFEGKVEGSPDFGEAADLVGRHAAVIDAEVADHRALQVVVAREGWAANPVVSGRSRECRAGQGHRRQGLLQGAVDVEASGRATLGVEHVYPASFHRLGPHLHAGFVGKAAGRGGHALHVQAVGRVGGGIGGVGVRLREAPQEEACTREAGTGVHTVIDRDGPVAEVLDGAAHAVSHVEVARAVAEVQHTVVAHLHDCCLIHEPGIGVVARGVGNMDARVVLKVVVNHQTLVCLSRQALHRHAKGQAGCQQQHQKSFRFHRCVSECICYLVVFWLQSYAFSGENRGVKCCVQGVLLLKTSVFRASDTGMAPNTTAVR